MKAIDLAAAGLIDRALQQELEVLRAARPLPELRRIELDRVAAEPATRGAVVAADAGNVELRLQPLRLGLVRVAIAREDGDAVAFECFLPLSYALEDQVRLLVDGPQGAVVQALLATCGLDPRHPGEWLSGLREPPRTLDFFRELLEWAVLVQEAGRKTSAPRLLFRDGLLRSVALPARIFERLLEVLRKRTAQSGTRVVAIAKRAPGGVDLVNYLNLTLSARLRDEVRGPLAFQVPPETERAFSPAAFASFEGRRRMGDLFLLALTPFQRRRPIAVEIPTWQRKDAEATLKLVAEGAHAGFPEPGFPPELARAHQAAAISPFQREYYARRFLRRVLEVRQDLRDALLAAHLTGGGVLLSPGSGEDA